MIKPNKVACFYPHFNSNSCYVTIIDCLTLCLVDLFDLILYIPVNSFSIMQDRSSWFEPVLSRD